MGDCLMAYRRVGDEDEESETSIRAEAGAFLLGLAIRSWIGDG